MFFNREKEDYRVRMYDKDFPWLWSICSDWSEAHRDITARHFRDETFSYRLPWSFTQQDRICYFDTGDAVRKIVLVDHPGATIGDAFMRFHGKYGTRKQVLHIAVMVDGEGIRIYRDSKYKTFEDFYREYYREYSRSRLG